MRALTLFGRWFAVALFAAVLLTTPAFADGATTTTTVTRDVHEVIPFTDGCTGESGTAHIDYTFVFVLIARPVDTYSLTMKWVGTFTLYPDDGGPSSTGRFAQSDTVGGGMNAVETINLNATGVTDDGSPFRIHSVVHLNENANGITNFVVNCV